MLTDVNYVPMSPHSVNNRLTHASEAGSSETNEGERCDVVVLDDGALLEIYEDRIRVEYDTMHHNKSWEARFDELPEWDLQPVDEVREDEDGDDRFHFIRAYGSDQTGGMVMVDWLEHRAGILICVTEECLLLYRTTHGVFLACEQDYFHLERGVTFPELQPLG